MKKVVLTIILMTTGIFASEINTALMKQGEDIFKQTCIGCHGADGKGVDQGGFTVQPRNFSKTILSEDQIFHIAKKGAFYWGAVVTGMPAWEYVYDDASLRAVAHYIHHTFGKKSSEHATNFQYDSSSLNEKVLKRGKKIYGRTCAYCHGKQGHGQGVATYNPEQSIFPYDLTKIILTEKQVFLFAKHGGEHWGSQSDDMPAWGVKYDDETLMGIAKYIETNLKIKR